MIKTNKIPTILGVIILIAGTFLGVFYLNTAQIFRIGASPQTTPKDVRVSNISDNSATVSWITDGETTDFLNWGMSQNSISKIEQEDNTNSKYYTHSVTLSGLTAGTTYYFKINSDGTTYDNNNVPWQFTTGDMLNLNTGSYPISGTVISASGTPQKRGLVYLNIGGYLLSTLTSDTGSFVFQIGSARTPDLKTYVSIDSAKTILEISVQAGQNGVSSVQVFPQSANPIPPITLGQVYDLRNLPPNQNTQNPNVNLQLPQNATSESKFDVSTVSGTTKTTSVILENVSQGDVISTTQPQFLGKGPGGEKITISVHSQTPVSQTITIPSNGSWSWTPPGNLDPGSHTITISWIDATGITRSLTRNFVVQASELPAFTASSSGTTATSTPTPTAASATALPASTSTPKPTPTLAPTPIPTPTATVQPVPVTGDLTPTLILSIMGIAILAFSFGVWKVSER